MNCYGQTTEGVKFGKVKNKNFLDLWEIGTYIYMNIFSQCKKSLQKSFIESQFGYCPLVWICYNRSCNNCINHLHERALWIAYNDNVSWFEDLLQRDQSVGIRHRNIRLLGIELWKPRNNISSHIMNEFFEQRNLLCNLWWQTDFKTG